MIRVLIQPITVGWFVRYSASKPSEYRQAAGELAQARIINACAEDAELNGVAFSGRASPELLTLFKKWHDSKTAIFFFEYDPRVSRRYGGQENASSLREITKVFRGMCLNERPRMAKLVADNPARAKLLHNDDIPVENMYGLVVSEANVPYNCEHGGSMYLCPKCAAEVLSGV